MSERWIAHICREEDGSERVQTVDTHCKNVARYAKNCLAGVGLGNTAYLAGLYHDAGKRKTDFKEYILAASHGDKVQKGSVVHTFAGVRLFLEKFHGPSADPYEKLTAELIAFAIGSHHGLFDCLDEEGISGFRYRMERPDNGYEEVVEDLRAAHGGTEIDRADFLRAKAEITAAVQKLRVLIPRDKSADTSELSFYFGLLARLLTSAVVEGDRRDTGEFMAHLLHLEFPENMRSIWKKCLEHMEGKLEEFQNDKPIFQARSAISQKCREAAREEKGIYTLNVPTGAGKTLSALRFALAHAQKWNCSRIIFTTPLLSILEQNAAVLREYIGNDDLILEHHSNVVREEKTGEDLDRRELLEDSWGSPIIITTLVQLLNVLFSGKMAAVRRFHSLCSSVIVMDEVQTIPLKMVGLFDLAVNFLTQVCGSTVVLCSATQPCFNEAARPIRGTIRNIVPPEASLWEPFRRTVLKSGIQLRLEEVPAFAETLMKNVKSLLIVCNKKDEARQVFQALRKGPWFCVHLSAAMCPAHRRTVLETLQKKLVDIREGRSEEPVICVSTQVIEAGVDISFARVARFIAGMDSAVQSAGRENRNGEAEEVQPVYLVDCIDEKLSRLPEIQRAKTASLKLMEMVRKEPEKYHEGLAGEQAILDYYRLLYRSLPKGYQDDTVGKRSLYQLLANHITGHEEAEHPFLLRQVFRTAGQLFQVFDEDTVSVLMPYGAGEKAIQDLNSSRAEFDLGYTKGILEKAKPYFVSLYAYQIDALQKQNGLHGDPWGRVLWLDRAFYDDQAGFFVDDPKNQFLEV